MTVAAYHTTQANIEAALTDTLAIENAARVIFDVPMIAGNFPKLGQRITIPDTAHVADLESYIRVRKLQFDFINTIINIEGEGGLTCSLFELDSNDDLQPTEAGISLGLFELDVNDDLEPDADAETDQYYELDTNDDIMPKAA